MDRNGHDLTFILKVMTIYTVLTNKLASQCDLAYRGLEVTCIWKAPEVLCTGIKRTYRYSYINRFDAMNT